jgi:hypothetical protein
MADLFQRYIGREGGWREGRKKGKVKNDVKKELEGIMFLLVLNLVEGKDGLSNSLRPGSNCKIQLRFLKSWTFTRITMVIL